MVQFYALSVFVNLIAGLVVSTDSEDIKNTTLLKVRDFVKDQTVGFTWGLLALVIGVFKLLSPLQGDVPVVGDIVPAVSGIALGVVMLFDFFKAGTQISSEIVDKIGGHIAKHRRAIGLFGMVSAVLHFFMPSVPIL